MPNLELPLLLSQPDQSVDESATHPVWTSLVILLLVVALTFAVTSAVLGVIVYRTRKDVKSWISSKLAKQRGMYICLRIA